METFLKTQRQAHFARSACQLHHHAIEKQKFSSESGEPHETKWPSTVSCLYLSFHRSFLKSAQHVQTTGWFRASSPGNVRQGSPCPCRVSSPAGDQKQKQTAPLHKVGKSDLSVHRALRAIGGREPTLDGERKVKEGQPKWSIE